MRPNLTASTISAKVSVFCILVFLLSGGSATIGKWASSEIASNGTDVARTTNAVRSQMQADMMHDALRADVFAAILSKSTETGIDLAEVQSDLNDHVEAFQTAIADTKSQVISADVLDKVTALDAPLNAYISGAKAIVLAANKDDKAAFDLLPAFRNQFSDLEKAMELAGDAISKQAEAINTESKKLADQISLLLEVIVGLTLVISVLMYLSSRIILVNPLKLLSSTMHVLASGRTEVDIKGSNRRDEIGDMARNVIVFRDAAIAKRELEAAAEDARLQAENIRLEYQRKAEADAAEQLRLTTRGFANAVQRLAGGDLSFEMDQQATPEFERLRVDFNNSLEQLSETMARISTASSVIDTGSREISHGADQLSRRTEQQAAALEQTAAALDEITTNVKSAARRVDEALGLSGQATSSAERSGEVVKEAVSAMTRIEQASNQISSIIGVIDEIAFQTNLLALNAGVEAARAGEAGKGFAVVAQEVRELAQRSAAAAKEIKNQIQSSNREVENGVGLVRETGEALSSIQAFIIHINEHMQAIAVASREQALGLSEINKAMNQMDQVTQQNAAMVEETTAASMNLASEVKELSGMLNQFKTRPIGSGRPVASVTYKRSA